MLSSRARWLLTAAVILACGTAGFALRPAAPAPTRHSVFDLPAPTPTSDPLEAVRRVQEARKGSPEAGPRP